MSIIKNLKGYIRRLSTPKKENVDTEKPLEFNFYTIAGTECFRSGFADGYFISVVETHINKDDYYTKSSYFFDALEKCQKCNIYGLLDETTDYIYFFMAGYSHDYAQLVVSLRSGILESDPVLNRSVCDKLEQLKSVWWNIYGSTSEYIDVGNNFLTEAIDNNIYPLKYLLVPSTDIMRFFGGVVILEKNDIEFISFNNMRLIVDSQTFQRNFKDYIEKFKNILAKNNIVSDKELEEDNNTFDSDIDELI